MCSHYIHINFRWNLINNCPWFFIKWNNISNQLWSLQITLFHRNVNEIGKYDKLLVNYAIDVIYSISLSPQSLFKGSIKIPTKKISRKIKFSIILIKIFSQPLYVWCDIIIIYSLVSVLFCCIICVYRTFPYALR